MKKLQEIDENQLGKNPFVQTLNFDVTEIYKDTSVKDDTDGAFVNGSFYWDRMPKVEFFYCPDCGNNIALLSDRAQRLLWHVAFTLKPKKDYLRINSEYYMQRNKIKSYTTFFNAVKELIRYEFIVPTHMKGVYWLNPWRFFPGNRLTKYPDKINITQRKPQHKAQ